MKLSEFLVKIGLSTSKSEAKRHIKAGAVNMIRNKVTYHLKTDETIIVPKV